MQAARAKIVFVMPRCRHDHVRGVHKQAYTLARDGHEIILLVKEKLVEEYLGMRVVAAAAPFESIFRPLLNLPSLFRQVRRLNADIFAAGRQLASDDALRARMGAAGKQYIETEFNWERIVGSFREIVAGLSRRQLEPGP